MKPIRRRSFGRLAENTVRATFWQAVRVTMQAVWVILIARLLGPTGYGNLAGVAGMATAIGGFTGLGMGLVLLQNVARHPSSFGHYWRRALEVAVTTGALLCATFVGIASIWLLDEFSPWALLAIGISEIIFLPIVSVCSFAFAAHERIGWSAAMPALAAATRLGAVAAFFILSVAERTLAAYMLYHLIASACAALVSWMAVRAILKPPATQLRLGRGDLVEGLGFSAVWAVGNALASLDKSLVLHFAGGPVAGLYAAAYRLATVFSLPMEALSMSASPRLFRYGSALPEGRKLVMRLFVVTTSYAVVAGLALIVVADVIPLLLGADFKPAADAARWMGLFLPFYGLRILGGDVLLAWGQKRRRVVIELTGLLSLPAFGLLWIPDHGLAGAVGMIVATEGLLATMIWIAIGLDMLSTDDVDPLRDAATSRPDTA